VVWKPGDLSQLWRRPHPRGWLWLLEHSMCCGTELTSSDSLQRERLLQASVYLVRTNVSREGDLLASSCFPPSSSSLSQQAQGLSCLPGRPAAFCSQLSNSAVNSAYAPTPAASLRVFYHFPFHLELPDYIWLLVQFEVQINKHNFLVQICSKYCMRHT
jgi:hypothetical protein